MPGDRGGAGSVAGEDWRSGAWRIGIRGRGIGCCELDGIVMCGRLRSQVI